MNSKPRPAVQWLAFAILSLAWGSSFLFIKIGVSHVGPLTLVAGRMLIGWLAVSLLLWRQGTGLPRRREEWGHLLFLGVLNTALPIYLISWGEQTIDSGVAAILNSTVPIWTILMAHGLLHDEKLRPGRIAGVATGFAGVLVLVGWPLQIAGNAMVAGQLAVVAAAFCYALGAVYTRQFLSKVPILRITWVTLLSAAAVSGSLALIVERPSLGSLHPASLMSMAWLGLVGTALAYQLYYRLLGWWGAARATSVTYMLPVVGLLLGVIFLSETVTLQILAGAALIGGGVLQTNRS